MSSGQVLDPTAIRPSRGSSTAISCADGSESSAVKCGAASADSFVAFLQVQVTSDIQRLSSSQSTFWLSMIGIAMVITAATTCSICFLRTFMSERQAEEPEMMGRAATLPGHVGSKLFTMGEGTPAAVDGSMASIKRRSTTQSTIPAKLPYHGASRGAPPSRTITEEAEHHPERHPSRENVLMPLCPLLVVPEGTRLACIVQNDLCRKRQELAFNVRGMRSRGGAALFQVRVSECGSNVPGVHAETLGGKEQLAFLSTADLWRDASRPKLVITNQRGETFGTMQSQAKDQYTLRCDENHFWNFTGDFRGHQIQVTKPAGEVIGSTWPGSKEEYQVFVHADADAGLLILGLMAIDKCEAEPNGNETAQ